MIDSSHYVFLPRWAKAVSITILLVGLMISIFLIYHYVSLGNMTDHTLSALAVAQLSVTGLVVALVLFFSEKEMSTKLLRDKTDKFLEGDLLTALGQITINSGGGVTCEAAVSILSKQDSLDNFGRVLTLQADGKCLRMWVGVNVNRVLVLYFLKRTDGASVEQLTSAFLIAFSGAESVGYSVDYLTAEFPSESIVCIRASCVMGDESFLAKPTAKLYWANDIALMTQSMFRTAIRNDIETFTETMPHPI